MSQKPVPLVLLNHLMVPNVAVSGFPVGEITVVHGQTALAKSTVNQGRERIYGLGGIRTRRFNANARTAAGAEHHQPHYRGRQNALTFAQDINLRNEAFRASHKYSRGTGMQPAIVFND